MLAIFVLSRQVRVAISNIDLESAKYQEVSQRDLSSRGLVLGYDHISLLLS